MQHFDYSEANGFFITINTFQKELVLATIRDSELHLNKAGLFVEETWESLGERFPTILLDSFLVMPNHVHGVLFLGASGADGKRAANEEGRASPARTKDAPPGLGTVVGAFKSISAIGCNRILGTSGRPFWHRNYCEHVVRSQADLDRIRQYIANNPANWAEDEENPEQILRLR
jgi:REP element-mobilizing transposase RayT